MLAACEAGEVFALLEGGAAGSRDASEALLTLYTSVRESWLTRALLSYHARTGSSRAIDLLARAPDVHARHLLDALQDQLRPDRDPAIRHQALAALAPLVGRRPAWLHRLPPHALTRDLLRVARVETAPLALLHALLTLAALLPSAPALPALHWPDLTDALLRPSRLEADLTQPARDHLQLAQLALFRTLYTTHPCTLLDTLRAEYAAARDAARIAWERALRPLLSSVRLHPALVTSTRQREADPSRWTRFEMHDVLDECRRLSLPAREAGEQRGFTPRLARTPATPNVSSSPAVGSGAHAARASSSLRPGTDPWFALGDKCGADSAPQTPLPADADNMEPETAVEATPENTPASEPRAQFRFPTDSATVRAIGRRSQPPSPLRKETSPSSGPGATDAYTGRLARVALDRAALEAEVGGGVPRRRAPDSPVPFGGAPPPAGAPVARPEPNRPPTVLDAEDREVLELTARSQTEDAWGEGAGEPPVQEMVRALEPRRRAAPLRADRLHPPPRRAASCPPARNDEAGAGRRTASVQTVDTWPAPYEFLIADFYRDPPEDIHKQIASDHVNGSAPTRERLNTYLAELYAGRTKLGTAEANEQLALLHAQLMYERWRREAHAERNRRLLGRCRQVRALELANAALRDRLRATTRERDELRSSLARERAVAGVGAEEDESSEAVLFVVLEQERAARIRAEARLHEAEAGRAGEAGELQRARGAASEAARHAEALGRAALAAERRADHVRRLRRELLVLAERDARLTAAARAAHAAHHPDNINEAKENALKAARERLAYARADAEAAGARAEAATGRAHELEMALASRDAIIAELKRSARQAAEEGACRIAAIQDKYTALLRVVRVAESRKLMELAGTTPPPPVAARAPPPAPAAPALLDCSRVRSLLETEDNQPMPPRDS